MEGEKNLEYFVYSVRVWLFLVLPLLPWERRLAQRWHYEHLDTWSVTLLYWQWIFSVSLMNALLPYLTISVRKIHVFSKMKSTLTSVLHLILLTHITPPFILILVLILKEFLSVICIQGCNSLSRQFIYLETHFCSCIFLIYAVMNFHFLSLHFISCVTVSPPWGERCPWPLRSFLCLTRVWTSWTPSASFPMMLTPRSPTTPSLPWAWWAVVSLGTIWNHEN